MVVSPTHRPPLPPRKYSWYSFVLEAESNPGSWCGLNDYINKKFQWHNQESNLRGGSAVPEATAPLPAPSVMGRTPVCHELLLKQWIQFLPRHICFVYPFIATQGAAETAVCANMELQKLADFCKKIYVWELRPQWWRRVFPPTFFSIFIP
jgi:hypothetical protein